MAYRRGPNFNPDVDAGLLRAIETVGAGYAPYDVEAFSGRAGRAKNPKSKHPHGGAIDLDLIDRATGRRIDNLGYGSAADIEASQGFANEVYKWAVQNDPELAKELVWGGYFAGGGWPRDRMHFQRGGTMAGGSWAGGFNPEYVKEAGLSGAGGVEAIDAQMKAAGYTPEQRRAAISAIESGNDYSARGPEADPAGHRALGKYQVMDYNVAPWAEQYLKMKGVTPEQFIGDPKLQDQLFDAVFGDYVSQYGERGAASKWFTGSENEPNRSDVNGKLTGKTYADTYMEQLARQGGGAAPNANTAIGQAAAGGGAGGMAKAAVTSPYALPQRVAGLGITIPPMAAPGGISAPGSEGRGNQIVQAEPRPLIDPEQARAKREMLAMALQRLNQGVLA